MSTAVIFVVGVVVSLLVVGYVVLLALAQRSDDVRRAR
jgi:hypothetical protein